MGATFFQKGGVFRSFLKKASPKTSFILRSVGIHREWMMAAARQIMALKLLSVLPARIAMRLNS
ncbi:hypothetical protein, partial [Acetobacter musti]|uniref:hypothetical protein n=1 Tax=Acetobacter musti TaxID=864732 RepID=UPI001A7EA731